MAEQIAIALFDAKPYDREFFGAANGAFGYDIRYFDDHLTPDTAVLADGCRVVCAFVNDSLDARVIEELQRRKVSLVALRSAGYNNVDLKAAYRVMPIVRVPGYSPHAVAEHAVALILALNRKIHKAYCRTRDGNFTLGGLLGFDMAGKVAGIVGAGRIGQIAAKILRGFDMEVLAYDPYPNEAFASSTGVRYVPLEEIYRRAEVITLHCPLTRDAHHLIHAGSLSKMKDGVMIVNTSRGGLIDTRALIDALKSGKVGSAGLDVYEEESEYFFEDFSSQVLTDDVLARLLTFSNVLVTSHQGFFTREAMAAIAQTTLQNVRDFFDNKPLENQICYRCGEAVCEKKRSGRCF